MLVGVKLTVFEVDNWYNCGKKDVLLATNAVLLKRQDQSRELMPGFENSIIVHHVSIGANCTIKNSIVGPHVCIGDNSVMNHAIVSDSIIGSYANIEGVVLQESIIGKMFIKFYYKYSPTAVELLKNKKTVNLLIRSILDKFVVILKHS